MQMRPLGAHGPLFQQLAGCWPRQPAHYLVIVMRTLSKEMYW
jgi:hypothetical protein